MQAEKIVILNNKNQKLTGHFYKNTSKTIIIICHGLETANDYPGIYEAFGLYHSTGVSVYSFDFSGYGGSDGEKKFSIRQRVSDIEKVIDYFSKDYKEIILYGISIAGVAVAIAAVKYKRITKLITINGLFTLNIKKLYLSQAIAISTYLLSHPQAWIELFYWLKHFQVKNITVPTLVVCGENDTIVKHQQSLDFYNKLKAEKKLISVPKGDHALMKREYLKVTIAIPQWIKQQVIY